MITKKRIISCHNAIKALAIFILSNVYAEDRLALPESESERVVASNITVHLEFPNGEELSFDARRPEADIHRPRGSRREVIPQSDFGIKTYCNKDLAPDGSSFAGNDTPFKWDL